jgi:tetratricopeptide (TPR) repeat protein
MNGTRIERIEVNQQAQSIEDQARQIGVEVGDVAGNLLIQVSTPQARRFWAPPGAYHKFFGRERELEDVIAALGNGDIVLLHGMGGIGKTRLGVEAVRILFEQQAFANGVFWLSEIGNIPLAAICDAIARRLGDREIPVLPPTLKPDATRELLAAYSDQLLVLDNLDSAESAYTFMDRCRPPDMALLITSRRRLSVYGLDIAVRPLPPDSAMDLFRDQARLASTENELVAAICQLLDYHPLALMIAAAKVWTEELPLASLQARLQDEAMRLHLLQLRGVSDKQRNLWASLQLSYVSLSEAERLVFTHLAGCFGQSVSLELLAHATGLSPDSCEDEVGRLIQQSVAERNDHQISLPRLVRDFGRELLGAELPAIQKAVANATYTYLETYAEDTPRNHDRLEAEVANLLGAVHYAMRAEAWEMVVAMAKRLVRPISGVFGKRGYWTELIAVGEFAVQAAAARDDGWALVRFRHNVATVYATRGDYIRARQLYEDNLAALKADEDPAMRARTLHNLGMVAHTEGRYDEARAFLQQSLGMKQAKPEEQRATATTLHELGRLAQDQGEHEEALHLFEKSLAVDRAFADYDGIAANQMQIGRIRQIHGDVASAGELYRETLEIYQNQLQDKDGVATVQYAWAVLLREVGEYQRADELLQKSLESSRSLGYRPLMATNLCELGILHSEQGDYHTARHYLEQSLSLSTQLQHRLRIADGRCWQGVVDAEEGNYERARQQLEESRAIYEELGIAQGAADTLYELGRLQQAQGHLIEAQALYKASLAIRERLRHKLGIARSRWRLGQLAQTQGDEATARTLYQRSLADLEAMNSPDAGKVREDVARLS